MRMAAMERDIETPCRRKVIAAELALVGPGNILQTVDVLEMSRHVFLC